MGLNVSPRRFREQLEAVARRFEFTTLSDVVGNRRNRPTVAITFDDGYTGVLDHAKPALQRMCVPASAFIPSGFVGSTREFWWEELAGLLFSNPRQPTTLRLAASSSGPATTGSLLGDGVTLTITRGCTTCSSDDSHGSMSRNGSGCSRTLQPRLTLASHAGLGVLRLTSRACAS